MYRPPAWAWLLPGGLDLPRQAVEQNMAVLGWSNRPGSRRLDGLLEEFRITPGNAFDRAFGRQQRRC
jgi:hypothetical protein